MLRTTRFPRQLPVNTLQLRRTWGPYLWITWVKNPETVSSKTRQSSAENSVIWHYRWPGIVTSLIARYVRCINRWEKKVSNHWHYSIVNSWDDIVDDLPTSTDIHAYSIPKLWIVATRMIESSSRHWILVLQLQLKGLAAIMPTPFYHDQSLNHPIGDLIASVYLHSFFLWAPLVIYSQKL